MPASQERCLSLSPAWVRILRVVGFTILTLGGLILLVLFLHRGLLPIIAWCFPQFEKYFYDLAVFGAYRTQSFVTFDLPAPDGVFVRQSDQCYDGHVFLAPNGGSVSQPGPMILDANGELIWMSNDFDVATNARVQTFNGEDYLTFWAGHKLGKLGQGATFMLDSRYNIAHKVHAVGEGLKADLHEFQLTEDGSALITVYNTTTIDLRAAGWGRPKDGWIEDCIFQEIDIATGELIFQWRAQDFFKPEDTYYWHPLSGYTKAIPMDFYHTNSVQKDSKGNFLISSRHFHHIAYLNGTSGEPIWILGGGDKYNQFKDLSNGLATGMKWQHHVRWISEEDHILSVMDNGNAGPLHVDAPYSKGLIIQLDMEKFTAKVLHEYKSLSGVKAASQGSITPLPNGNVFVGWGSTAAWTEYDSEGSLLCEYHFGAALTFWWERAKNYRTFKYRGWVGRPEKPPSVNIHDSRIYVSWNGATEVRYWELQGLREHDSNHEHAQPESFETLEVMEKNRFEESFEIASRGSFGRFKIAALDSSRQVLGVSRAVSRDSDTASHVFGILQICAGIVCVLCLLCLWLVRRGSGKLSATGQRWKLFDRDYRYSRL